jgi:sulfatase modifying factor 1
VRHRAEAERDGQGGWGWNRTTESFEDSDPKYTWRSWGVNQSDDHPVGNVTWNDAVAFGEWLSAQEGKRYRLPTEAEWEYACRAGTTTAWQQGNDPEGLASVGNVWDAAAQKYFSKNSSSYPAINASDGGEFTAPVGRFRSNSFGLYDLHGNVWEWCQDRYDREAYQRRWGTTSDPLVTSSGGDSRVLRGGGWSSYDGAGDTRSAFRIGLTPDARGSSTGFRVARTP